MNLMVRQIASARPRPMRRVLPKVVAACSAVWLVAVVVACGGSPDARKQQHLDSGNRYAEKGKLREAIIEYRNAIQVDPLFAAAHVKLAAAHEALGESHDALDEYVRASDLLPEDVELQLKAAALLVAAGRATDALTHLEILLQRHPEHVEGQVLRGRALAESKDLDAALVVMEGALRLDPARAATYLEIGTLQTARGAQGAAEAALMRAVALAPALVDARLALADLYWSSGRLPDAERVLLGALDVAPTHEGASRAMAMLATASGRADLAEQYLRRSADASGTLTSILALADFYLTNRRPKDAIAVLQPLEANLRSEAEVEHRLARAYAGSGDWSTAFAIADKLLAFDVRDSEALLLKGQLLLESGRHAEALDSINAAVAADPWSTSAQLSLGRVLAARGDVPGAERAFRELLRLNPSASTALVELSLLQLASGSAAQALRTATAAARVDPRNLDVRLALVRSQLAVGEVKEARGGVYALLAEHPTVAAVHTQNGVLLGTGNEPAAARAAFRRALELDATSLEALAGLVALELQARDYEPATRRIERRLAEGAVTTPVLLLAARTYSSVGNLDAAEQALRRAIDGDAASLTAYAMLAQLYLSQRKVDQALEEFDALAAHQARPVSTLTMAGLLLQSQGKDHLARQRYERALIADPGAAVAANNLAWLLAEAGERLDEALRLARLAADALPDTPEVLDTLGWVHHQSGMPSLAIPPLTRCVARDPKNATCRYHLGLVYAKAGDAMRARESLVQALSLGGDAVWAGDARRALATLGRDVSR